MTVHYHLRRHYVSVASATAGRVIANVPGSTLTDAVFRVQAAG